MNLVKFLYYEKENGKAPFVEWINKLDESIQLIIFREIDKVFVRYNFGNVKRLGDKLYEIKINTGPGYRIYFAKINEELSIILLGGHKGTQQRDIEKAKMYWSNYGWQK